MDDFRRRVRKWSRRSRQYVTVAPDSGHLSPWRTWPSLHRGVPDDQHLISDLGQDRAAADEAYPPVWSLLHAHGASVGVCGSLHSSPPPDHMESYAFYLPDAFAADDRAHPRVLSRFQAFNLAMTARPRATSTRRSPGPTRPACWLCSWRG